MKWFSFLNILYTLAIIVAVVLCISFVAKYWKPQESFVDEEAPQSLNEKETEDARTVSDEDTDSYQATLFVMKTFDLFLNRNPSSTEIEKYSKYTKKQFLKAFKNDYSIGLLNSL